MPRAASRHRGRLPICIDGFHCIAGSHGDCRGEHRPLSRFRDLPANWPTAARLVPVYRRLVSDSLTPVSAFHKIDAGRCACLFESVVGGEKVGRYSFLATEPVLRDRGLRQPGDDQRPFGRLGRRAARRWSPASSSAPIPLDELRRRVEAIRAVRLPELPPFCSGGGGLRRLRHGPLLRAAAQRPARRPPGARPGLRLLRPDGGLRQRGQDDRRGGHGPAGQAGGRRRRRPTTRPGAASTPWSSSWPRRPPTCSRSTSSPAARCAWPYHSNFTQAEFEEAVRAVRRVHPRRRHLPGRPQPAAGSAAPGPSLRDLPHAAGGQPQPVHVLPAHAQRHAGGQLAGGHGPRGRRPGDRPPAGRHPPPRRRPTRKTAGWPRSCWPTPRSGPST